jgi:predicted nucleotidyltransferase/plasmid maintenance system antidote protein VapI
MQEIGNLIRKLRLQGGYPLRKVAAYLDIDQAVLSKIEHGKRHLTREQVVKLARFFNYKEREMLLVYLSDRILQEIGDDIYAEEALKAAEQKIQYKTCKSVDRKEVISVINKILPKFPGISRAWIYGSFARGEDQPGSDIDIALEVDAGFSYFDLAGLQHMLEETFKRKVDVGVLSAFKPRILKNIERDLIQIYERQKAG